MLYLSRINLSFSSTFPGKITIFKAKLKIKHFSSTPLKFKHFSRSVRTLNTFFDKVFRNKWTIGAQKRWVILLSVHVCQYIYLLEFLMNNLFFMLFWNNDYSRGLAGHTWPVTSVVRQASAQCCWLCYLSSDGLEESERHRSQKIYRSSEENRSKWVLFRIALYRSSGYNLIFCPAVSAELPGVLMFWNPTDAGHKVACRACVLGL